MPGFCFRDQVSYQGERVCRLQGCEHPPARISAGPTNPMTSSCVAFFPSLPACQLFSSVPVSSCLLLGMFMEV